MKRGEEMFNSPLNQRLTDTDLTSHYRSPPEPLLKTVEMIQSKLAQQTEADSSVTAGGVQSHEAQTPLWPLHREVCKFPEAQVKS